MGRELQAVNHKQLVAEWSKRVEACRNSGQTAIQWCGENGAAAPKPALGRTLTYLKDQRPYLLNYLRDGRLELSNNRVERSIALCH